MMDNDLRKRVETISKLLNKALDKSRHLNASYDVLQAAASLAHDAVKQWPVQAETPKITYLLKYNQVRADSDLWFRGYHCDDKLTHYTIDPKVAHSFDSDVAARTFADKYGFGNEVSVIAYEQN